MELKYVNLKEKCDDITNIHPDYAETRFTYMSMRDFRSGSAAVKRANERYLPIPSGFLTDNAQNNPLSSLDPTYQNQFRNNDDEYYNWSENPDWHPIKPYATYKAGAKVPGILKHTITGLLGLIIKKPMEFVPVDEKSDMSDDQKQRWLKALRELLLEDILQGRVGITLDSDDNPVVYDALSMIDWEPGRYVVLRERKLTRKASYAAQDYEYIRISFTKGTTYYERFNEHFVLTERKKTTKYSAIPFWIVGSTNSDWKPDVIPLEGIMECAKHVYMKSADLSYAEFTSCVPTLVITGVRDEGSAQKPVGGGVALIISNELAKVYYPQTDTNALQHVKIHIDALFEEAKGYGASLLGGDKDEVESAEAIRLRQSASGASLSTLTRTVEATINDILKVAFPATQFLINFALEDNYLTPQEQAVLLDSWMKEGLSYKSYFNSMQKAGLIVDDRTPEEELELIATDRKERDRLGIKIVRPEDELEVEKCSH